MFQLNIPYHKFIFILLCKNTLALCLVCHRPKYVIQGEGKMALKPAMIVGLLAEIGLYLNTLVTFGTRWRKF
jgi:hypothetical protein